MRESILLLCDLFTLFLGIVMAIYNIFIDSIKIKDLFACVSVNVSNSSNSWIVNFKYGNDNNNNKSNKYFVRCVRGRE